MSDTTPQLPTKTRVRCEGSGLRPTENSRCPVCGVAPFMISNNTFPEHGRLDFTDPIAERIVRSLAASDPWAYSTDVDERVCALCEQLGFDDHKADCPWRLASEWVAAHATPSDREGR